MSWTLALGDALGWGCFSSAFTSYGPDLWCDLLTTLRGQAFHLKDLRRARLRSPCHVNFKRTSSLKNGKCANAVSSLAALLRRGRISFFFTFWTFLVAVLYETKWPVIFPSLKMIPYNITYLSCVAKSEYWFFQCFAPYFSWSWRLRPHQITLFKTKISFDSPN